MSERIEEIKARLEKATKGDWTHQPELYSTGVHCNRYGFVALANTSKNINDMEFIAHSKADIEFLLGEVDLLEKKLAKAIEQRNSWIKEVEFQSEEGISLDHAIADSNKEIEEIK